MKNVECVAQRMPTRTQEMQSAERSAESMLDRLLRRVAAGEQLALSELYQATAGRIYGLARFMLRDLDDAEEVVGDTYTQVWQTAGRFDGSRARALGWMLMICRSRAMDLIRRRQVHGRFVLEEICEADLYLPYEPPSDALLEEWQDHSDVHEALSSLPELRRQLVGLAFLQGLSHQEIAERTGLPVGTVKSNIRRSLALLRAKLNSRNTGHCSGVIMPPCIPSISDGENAPACALPGSQRSLRNLCRNQNNAAT